MTATNTVTGFPSKHRHEHAHLFVYIMEERAYTQATLTIAHIQKAILPDQRKQKRDLIVISHKLLLYVLV